MAIIDTIGSRGMLPTKRRLPRFPLEKPFGTPLTKISDGQDQPPATMPQEQPPGVSVSPLPGKPAGLSPRRIAEIRAKVAAGQMSMDDAQDEIRAANPFLEQPQVGGQPKTVTLPTPAEVPMPEYVPPAPPPAPTRQQLEQSQWEAQWADQSPNYDPEPGANLPSTFWTSQPPGTQQRFWNASRAEKAFFVENGRLPTDVTELNIWLGRKGRPLVPVPATPTPGIPPAPAPTEQLVTAAKPPAAFQPAETLPKSPITFKGITVPPNQELEQPPDLTSWADQYKSPEGATAKPTLMSEVERLLQERIGSSVDEDPRYLSQLSDLTKQQTLRREQRKRDLIGLGIVKGDGSDFAAFDTLGEQDTREQQNLRANVENLRQQDIQSSLARLSQQEQERQARAQEGLATGGLTGIFGGAFTEEARRNRAQETLAVGVATGTMPLVNLDGTPAMDPNTGRQRYGTTLDAQRLGLQTQELYGGTAPPVEFSRNDFIVAMGKKTGDAGYNPAFDIDRDGTITETDISIVGADAKDLGGGRYSYTPAGSRTLAARTQGAQLGIQEREQNLNEQRTYGGQWTTDATGAKKWQPTLESSQWSETMKLNYDKLREDTRQARVQERLQIADRTGLIDEPGKLSIGDFRVAMVDSSTGKAFDPAFDFTGDGKVDYDDFFKGHESGLLSDKPFSTLAAKKQEAEIANAAAVLQLDKDKLTEATRQFNKKFGAQQQEFLTKTTGYVYDVDGNPVMKRVPDVSQGFTQKNAQDMDEALAVAPGGVIRGTDPGYSAYFDLNDDQQIDRSEFMDAINTAQSTRVLGVFTAKTTSNSISTLEREQFQTDKDQWEKKFGQSIDEFLASMGFSREKLAAEKDANKLSVWLRLIGAFVKGAATYGASRGRSGSTAGGEPEEEPQR